MAVDLSTVEEIDRRYHHPSDVITPPTDCHQTNTLILVHSNGRKHQVLPNIPPPLANSNSGFARTLFYLTMATKLSHVYAPHADRAALLDRLSARQMGRSSRSFSPSTAETVVRDVDSQLYTDQFRTNQFDIGAPPIADYVRRKCKRLTELPQVIASVRQEAAEFRTWCAELEDAYRSGRPGVSKIQQMRAQLASAIDAWKLHIGEGVKYESRKIQITWLEKFVKVDGLTNRTVKDPVLWSRYKPLVFINSLYRPS
jgi:hypothetical protein